MWRVHLLAGGADPAAAARVAGLVCASADLQGLPYTLAPARTGAGALRDLLGSPAAATATVPAGPPGPRGATPGKPRPANRPVTCRNGRHGRGRRRRVPFSRQHRAAGGAGPDPGSGDTRNPAGPPPGLRRHPGNLRDRHRPGNAPQRGSAAVPLGQVLDRQRNPAGALRVPLDSLNRHVFVCGATGGGKSQTVRGLLEAASRAGVPWLVVEPAKAEYRLMTARLAGSGAKVVRIRPGEADAVAAGLNPLEPAADEDGEPVPSADPRRPRPGPFPRRLPVRRALPAGAQRGADARVRGRRVGPGPG